MVFGLGQPCSVAPSVNYTGIKTMTRLSNGPADDVIRTEDQQSQAPAPESNDSAAQPRIDIDDELIKARALLQEVFLDSGFQNLFEPLQDKISEFVN